MTQQRTFPENVRRATSERDELGKLLFTLPVSDRAADTAPEIMVLCDEAAEAILEAGYVKPRIITDREGFRGLPDGSILMSGGRYAQYSGAIWRFDKGMLTRVGKELQGVTPVGYFVDPLPVTVIHEPVKL